MEWLYFHKKQSGMSEQAGIWGVTGLEKRWLSQTEDWLQRTSAQISGGIIYTRPWPIKIVLWSLASEVTKWFKLGGFGRHALPLIPMAVSIKSVVTIQQLLQGKGLLCNTDLQIPIPYAGGKSFLNHTKEKLLPFESETVWQNDFPSTEHSCKCLLYYCFYLQQ